MRRVLYIICLLIIAYPVGASALTGLSIGGKLGVADYSGDILPGSGDLGSGTGYAVILGFGAVPVVNFEIRASYFAKDFTFGYEAGGVPFESTFEFRDIGLSALLAKDVFAPPGAPFAFYLGGGIGYHVINTEVAAAALSGQVSIDDADNPVTLMKNTGKMSAQGLIGLRLGAPVFPLSAFAEFGYGVIFASERLGRSEFAAGLTLRF